jgi:hypothetical protein
MSRGVRENSIKLYIEISKPYIDFVKSYINLPWNRRSQSKLECSICFGIDAGCSITFLCGHAGFTFVHTGLPKNRESCVYECKSCVFTQDFRENPVCLCPVKVSIWTHRYTGMYFDPFLFVCVCVCVQLKGTVFKYKCSVLLEYYNKALGQPTGSCTPSTVLETQSK